MHKHFIRNDKALQFHLNIYKWRISMSIFGSFWQIFRLAKVNEIFHSECNNVHNLNMFDLNLDADSFVIQKSILCHWKYFLIGRYRDWEYFDFDNTNNVSHICCEAFWTNCHHFSSHTNYEQDINRFGLGNLEIWM